MSDTITSYILPVAGYFHEAGYWVAFFAALVETALIAGLFIPGSTLLLFLGALSASGRLDFTTLLYFAIVGAVIGDNLNFWLGKRYGRCWTSNGIWLLRQEHFEHASRFFARHGARSVFLGRFVPTIKELVPFVAGTVNMRRRSFMFWNVLGAIGWGLEWLGAGYLFAHSLNLAQLWLSRAGLLLATLLILFLLLLWFKRFLIRYGQQWLHFVVSVWDSVSTAVISNQDVIRLVRRHPRLFAFLSARLDRGHFCGMPLTLSGVAFLYTLALFGGVIEDLLGSDPLVAVDHSLAQMFATLRTPGVVQFFIRVTELGMWQVISFFTLIAAAVLWLTQRRWIIAGLLTSMAGSIAFTTLGKLAFHRPRPLEAVLAESSYSFPSGHATIAVAFYGFLGYLLIRHSDTWGRRVNVFLATLVLILFIGLSRIVLGVHYLSDVWGGYLVGTLWLIIGISLSEWRLSERKAGTDAVAGIAARRVSVSMAVIAISAFVVFSTIYTPRLAVPVQIEMQLVQGDPVRFLKAHVPAYTETAFGKRQLPLAILLLARDESALQHTLHKAGWQRPGEASIGAMAKRLKSGWRDAQLPLPPAFWNGHINDLAFIKAIETGQTKQIVAVQLWATPYLTPQGRAFVAVAMAFDGVRWRILRSISPDLDAARDAFIASLHTTGVVQTSRLAPFVEPAVGKTLTGNPFFSHGQILVVNLPAEKSVAGSAASGSQ